MQHTVEVITDHSETTKIETLWEILISAGIDRMHASMMDLGLGKLTSARG